MSPDEYIEWIIEPAKIACEPYGLPWQAVVAQGAIESGWGRYGLGNGKFNIFGRKWGGIGEYVEVETDECYNGVWETIVDKFQSYDSMEEAVKDWCELVTWCNSDGSINYKQYADQYFIDGDIEAFVRGIGSIYATDPEYANKVCSTMRACGLI